jgi:AcrR family transcriptional regulator
MLRSAIERNAVALALEHGYDNVTVDMICERSMASPRTFFNYFGSKEAVILGPPPPPPAPEMAEKFIHRRDSDILSDLTRMTLSSLDQHGDIDFELWRKRREIIRQSPELLRSQAEQFAAKHVELVELVKQRIQTQHARRSHQTDHVCDEDLLRQARLVVSLWSGIAHYVMKSWVDRPEMSAQQIMDDLLPLLAQIKEL